MAFHRKRAWMFSLEECLEGGMQTEGAELMEESLENEEEDDEEDEDGGRTKWQRSRW